MRETAGVVEPSSDLAEVVVMKRVVFVVKVGRQRPFKVTALVGEATYRLMMKRQRRRKAR